MSWVITGSEKVTQDPFLYTNTVLLLKGDGTNGSTTILDSSKVAGGPKTVTAVGNAQISTAVADPFGNSTKGVIAFDGTGDRLTLASNPAFAVGTANFTIEGWVRLNALQGAGIFQQGTSLFPASFTNSLQVGPNLNGTWELYAKNTFTSSAATYLANTWYFFALTRNGTNTNLYIDGTSVIALTADTTDYTGTFLGLGSKYGINELNGYVDEFRFTKGVARYTANFTPPTAPFPDI
jgi:hypothetical protein